ncbi:MAG: hypothetical protein PW789_14870 [Edaphobacter sp.]|uniref:hypothetical protein n=1 Tax=Edaphobacter sp. TaxID=1934404 RepID=UPI00238C24B1|nr:hypothetical protein [Edaphobacter sp.]MDE1177859.1 hypothetical protein [Edaphobacter sp.]
MWPKVLMQLFELLPHVSRLVPIADRYLSAKASSETANEAAFSAIAEDVRGDLGQVTRAHAALYRQLQDHGNQISELSTDLRITRTLAEQNDKRLAAIDNKLDSLDTYLKVSAGLLVLLVILVLVLIVRGH